MAQYSEYFLHLVILICMYSILAQSFNLTFGLGGLFNLAHVASYAIGAYTTALLSTQSSLSTLSIMLLSAVFSAIFSLSLGLIALRLAKDYFAIGSMAFSALITALIVNWKSLTRGVLGIPAIPRPEIFGLQFEDNLNFLILIAICSIFSQLALWMIFNSALGRALRAQAESEHASLALGNNIHRTRNLAFFVSSGFAGLAGSFYAYYINYVDPSSFSFNESIFILSLVVVGGPGLFWGVIGGTVFLLLLPEPLRFIEIRPDILGPMRQLIVAIILFAMVYIRRKRLFPLQRRV